MKLHLLPLLALATSLIAQSLTLDELEILCNGKNAGDDCGVYVSLWLEVS